MQVISSRKPTKFTSTISDERGEDVEYNHVPLTNYVSDGSIARVIWALWLKRELPEYALSYINTILILLADHGPAVSGATNTIVTSRAGKDILSSLVSGLLTIGPRFGGAIDGAARTWYEAVSMNETPEELMNRMKKIGNPIQGIGHKVKSKFNPDGRCVILKDLAKKIPSSKYLNYALSVEALTLEKKANLILNVDGHIAASLLDIFESVGMEWEEIRMYIDAGIFNAFFILARSIGFIGHALDQKRLGEPLYRTAWEDIHYGE
jgi:ATP-citrate lyase alpha-subunit